jgi:hypothetical protein
MSPKLSGREKVLTCALLALFTLVLHSCTSSTTGNPRKVVEDYINAIQNGDFETIYRLNRVTARQKKFIGKSGEHNSEVELKELFAKHKATYESFKPELLAGAQWAEKYYFSNSSTVIIGQPKHPPVTDGETQNAEYEKGKSMSVSVSAVYAIEKDAPIFNARRIKEATYDCFLGKIRYGDNVQIYPYDKQWFFAGCILDNQSVLFFQP